MKTWQDADKKMRSLVACSLVPEAEQMASLLAKIVRLTSYNGIGNLQYKITADGVIKARRWMELPSCAAPADAFAAVSPPPKPVLGDRN